MSNNGALSSGTTGSVGKSRLDWRGIAKLYLHGSHNNVTIAPQEGVYDVWNVTCSPGKAFSVPGDSGAWVWNKSDELVGMILGGHTEKPGLAPISYFTSWGCVAACIEAHPRVKSMTARSRDTANEFETVAAIGIQEKALGEMVECKGLVSAGD